MYTAKVDICIALSCNDHILLVSSHDPSIYEKLGQARQVEISPGVSPALGQRNILLLVPILITDSTGNVNFTDAPRRFPFNANIQCVWLSC